MGLIAEEVSGSEPYDKDSSHKRAAVYMRCSTMDQTLESQRIAIQEYLATREGDFADVRWYEDVGFSGANNKRPAFLELLKDVGCRRIRTVIVYKLDRLSRISSTAMRTVLRFDEMKCDFISITQPHFNTPAFRLAVIAMFADLSQLERDQTVERIKAGMAAARARGSQIGRKPVMTPEVTERALQMRQQNLSFKKIATALGVSVGAVHKALSHVPNNAKYHERMKTPVVKVSKAARVARARTHDAGYTARRSQNGGWYFVCNCCQTMGPISFTKSAAKDGLFNRLMEI